MTKRETVQQLSDLMDEWIKEEWGFTGTRAGMTEKQKDLTRACLTLGQPAIIRHGAAYGADREFHAIWREELPRRFADVWPADDKSRKLFDDQDNVAVNPVLPPLQRNEEIVKRSKYMIATPHTQQEELRSGTWATVRCARRLEKPCLIIWPNGVMTLDFQKFLVRIVR